jgi:hypothetical protein
LDYDTINMDEAHVEHVPHCNPHCCINRCRFTKAQERYSGQLNVT